MGYNYYISLILAVFVLIISFYNRYQANKFMKGYSFLLTVLSSFLLICAIIIYYI